MKQKQIKNKNENFLDVRKRNLKLKIQKLYAKLQNFG